MEVPALEKSERPDESEISPFPLKWLVIAASTLGLIGAVGLIVLISSSAWASPPSEGFQSGHKTFSNNPFVNPPPPPDMNDEDVPGEDFEPSDMDGGFENPPRGAGGPSGGRGGVENPPRGGNRNQAFSMGGTPPGGVTSKKAPPPIQINTETGLGEGSKAMVTDFNFPDADILDIAKTLGKLTGKNFILDKDVKGRITIISNSPITIGDAWKAFLTALDMSGYALIPSGKYIRIARQRDARDKQLKTFTGDFSPDTDALITRVFPLKYIDSDEITRVLRSFMPSNSRIIPHDQTNTVIVTDTGSNIAKIARMLEILDIEGYDAGIEVIPVKFASASELSKLIDTLIPGTGGRGGAGGGPRFGGGSRFAARRTKEGGIINTIIADERTNTLIVHANSKGADQVRQLVAKLDQKLPAQVGGGKVHVKYLQFADAEQISNTLNTLSQASGASRPSGATTGGTGVNPVSATLFEGAIKVAPDKATNSLVITASPADFATVERVIAKLDIPRDEVYVEVVIMEMALTRDFTYSSNIVSPSNGIALQTSPDLINFLNNPASATGMVLGFKSGKTVPLQIGDNKTIQISSVQGLIRALQTNNNANVLATPQILTLDNTEATFDTTDRIPVPVTTAVQGAISTSVTKEPVSLSIKLKPQINTISNYVKLEVTAKLAGLNQTLVPSALQSTTFATTERNAQTTVMVADSDTVVLGGLTRDDQNEQISKIPILGDIPLLGWLFRSKTSNAIKKNLLIFITPHIVKQYEKIRAIMDKKLKQRDDFLEKNAGGKDPYRDYRDDMIRSLPDVKELMSYKPQTTATIGNDEESPAPTEGLGSLRTAPPKTEAAPGTPTGPANPAAPGTPGTPGNNGETPPAPPPTIDMDMPGGDGVPSP